MKWTIYHVINIYLKDENKPTHISGTSVNTLISNLTPFLCFTERNSGSGSLFNSTDINETNTPSYLNIFEQRLPQIIEHKRPRHNYLKWSFPSKHIFSYIFSRSLRKERARSKQLVVKRSGSVDSLADQKLSKDQNGHTSGDKLVTTTYIDSDFEKGMLYHGKQSVI